MDKTETMQAWQYDTDGLYKGEITLTWMNRSPISGKWQIPAEVTTIEPPAEKEGFNRVFKGNAWAYEEIPVEPEPPEPTPEEKKRQAIQALDAQYNADKNALTNDYVAALMSGDDDLAEELKAELVELNEEYDVAYAEIVGEE